MTYVLIAAAVAIFLWPSRQSDSSPMPFGREAADNGTPTYQSAHIALAHVRLRLLQTEHLSDSEKKAIEALTLALVAGSDKQ